MSNLIVAMRACGVGLLWATAAVSLSAQALGISPSPAIFTTLQSFDATDGASPGGLLQAANGRFYAITAYGGLTNHGTIVQLPPGSGGRSVHNFHGTEGDDLFAPVAPLVQGTDGKFYGTAFNGGAYGLGTVFRIDGQGILRTLYNFCPQKGCVDGGHPAGALIQASDGNFYGTTAVGGARYFGTVYKITPSGVFTTLYSFCPQDGCPDGAYPYATLVEGADGNFYGTAGSGGFANCTNGCGTVFKISPSGALTTLYSFCSQTGCPDGSHPTWGLVQGADGDFYGTTVLGGAAGGCAINLKSGCGTAFKITPGGALVTLHQFDGTDGDDSNGPLVLGTDGNFYGSTAAGGAIGYCFYSFACGTLFRITPSGVLTTLYSFCAETNCADGQDPGSGLIQDTDGKFYGTTANGGAYSSATCPGGCGTVFSLSVGLSPFVKTLPVSGVAGAVVHVFGAKIAGATSVTFNGTPAAFTVKSQT